MRATDFIRNLLDFIDGVGSDTEPKQVNDYEDEVEDQVEVVPQGFSNSPDEHVTSTDTILSMGNDLNKPKHAADLRASTVALYPDAAYKGR